MLVLRAHHLLCIQGYVGNGYNREFVYNMNRVIKALKYNPYIKIIAKTDVICSACPHNTINSLCEDEYKVSYLDNEVLKLLGINSNSVFHYKSILKILKEKLDRENFIRICSNCGWFSQGYCEKGLFTK
jgi:hypothetical protein